MNKIIKLLLSLYLFITSLLVSVIFVINLVPLYQLSIKWFNLTKATGLPSSALMEDYITTIKYLQIPWINKLEFKHFAMSKYGEIHFAEVKEIFLFVYILFFMCLILGFIFYLLYKQSWFKPSLDSLNYFFYITLALITITIAGFYMNFTFLFNKFHSLFFNNDYWIFDYRIDPIILALPEEFFMLCAIAIVTTTLILAILGKIIYSRVNKIKSKEIFYTYKKS